MDGYNPFSSDPRGTPQERDQRLRKQSLRQSWPLMVLVPILVGVLFSCCWAILIELLLGPSFGMSGGRSAPWPGAIAGIFVASFWTNRLVYGRRWPLVPVPVISLCGALVAFAAWLLLEPSYRDTKIWSHPAELVRSEGYLVPPLMIALIVWWVGLAWSLSIANISAEDVRLTAQRQWILLVLSILLAAMAGGDAGRRSLDDARWAVPIGLIATLAVVAGAEVENTRRLAVARGAQPPGWGRWFRLVAGLVMAVGVITFVVATILGPGSLQAIVEGCIYVLRAVGLVLAYVLYAVVWTIFQIFNAIASLFEGFMDPVELPEQPQFAPPQIDPITYEEGSVSKEWKYAVLLRWGVLGIAVIVIALLIARLRGRAAAEEVDTGIEETRESVFSGDLARKQLRDLFRRRGREGRPQRLDLSVPPASLRETMTYLEVLARRQESGRREVETPADFSARLRAIWPGLASPLIGVCRDYEAVRYGEIPDPPDPHTLTRAQRDWALIWERRKDWAPPSPDDPPTKP